MSQQAFLFDAPAQPKPAFRQPAPPVLQPQAAQVATETADLTTARPWRAPTRGEETCHGCRAAAPFQDGKTAWCRRCLPAGFMPSTRAAR